MLAVIAILSAVMNQIIVLYFLPSDIIKVIPKLLILLLLFSVHFVILALRIWFSHGLKTIFHILYHILFKLLYVTLEKKIAHNNSTFSILRNLNHTYNVYHSLPNELIKMVWVINKSMIIIVYLTVILLNTWYS